MTRRAHDDDRIEELYVEFSADVETIQDALTAELGPPKHKGKSNHKFIPLNGVFRYALWEVGDKHLFVAAHHEDREIPIILALGTVEK